MVERQRLRGPDDRGFCSDGPVTLGMCRLAIIDPANGHQPMVSANGRFSLVFNGAIYNHRELRTGLEARGWNFRTHCDTEVLLAAFALDGAACLGRLRGMFAFAVWDAREQKLFAARDALGIKPLYYARLPDSGLIFASEIKALLAGGLVPREIDPVSVSEYLAWFSVPAPRTIYRGVANLPPGHCLTADAGGRVRTEPWWHLPAPTNPGHVATNYHDFVHGLRYQLEDSIRAHRVADVPVGAFLSGGMDSTAVVGLMARSGATKLKTFSLIFGEAGFSEQASARLAAQTFGTEHHEELITGARIAADLPRILASFDQPTGDGINTYYASQTARAGGVTVALSGLGGDELFGGYPSFRDLPRLDRLLPLWRKLPGKLRATIVAPAARAAQRARAQARRFPRARPRPPRARLAAAPRAPGDGPPLPAFARHARARATPRAEPPDAGRLRLRAERRRSVPDHQRLGTAHLHGDVLLRDSDVFSMAHSLELRVPFVDRVLLEWLWPQPAWFKYDPRFPKKPSPMRPPTSCRPPSATAASKASPSPSRAGCSPSCGPSSMRLSRPPSLAACPWLEPGAVAQVWADYKTQGDPRAWSRVWTLAVLIAFANRREAP